jgi:glutamate-1-semialdehyde 2,1-aminomutase
MQDLDGYALIRSVGEQIVERFASAIDATGVEELLSARAIFGGAMFEILFKKGLVGNWSARQELRTQLAEAGVLILQGHPSYPCLAHVELDFDDFEDRISLGLRHWQAEISSTTTQL